jgi:hypothetical protein
MGDRERSEIFTEIKVQMMWGVMLIWFGYPECGRGLRGFMWVGVGMD